MARMKECVAAVVLSLLSVGLSAPLSSCDSLLKPISVSNEDISGRWLYIGGSSDLPGSRSMSRLMTSAWLDVTATTQDNVLHLLQTQRIVGKCFSIHYNVNFENSTLFIEEPFYLKEVYLQTGCSDCLLAYEQVVSGNDTFTSLLLFSRRKSVSPAVLEMLKRQAECLQMSSPIMMDPDYEICPDNIPPSEGIAALNSLFEAKMGHKVFKFLDSFFEMFVN
ncbi:uncharacterized protein LOC119218405 [Pungitius pungitius]|uniref:uncharacterized protein LOC119218405 n=1 Tax=Pungitius pungitius TaxID=134920 RepID=UPI002E0FD647